MVDATAIATLGLAAITYLTVREMQRQQKRNKLTEEMSLLVGPLYSKRNDEVLFGRTLSPPNRDFIDDIFQWRYYYNFWDSIITNMYLTPAYLRERLNGYLVAKDAYWTAFGDQGHRVVGTFDETPLGQRKRETLDLKRRELRSAIDVRRYSLTTEIDQIENWPRFWNRLLGDETITLWDGDLQTQTMPVIKHKMTCYEQVGCTDKNFDCKRFCFQGFFAEKYHPPFHTKVKTFLVQTLPYILSMYRENLYTTRPAVKMKNG